MADELAAERPRSAAAGLVRRPALPGRLEQLDGVAVGILQLNLFAAGTLLDLVAEAETGLLHRLDERRQVIDFEDDPVPPARLLLAAVRQWPRPRTLRAAEPEGEAPVRDGGEGWSRRIPRVQFEAQVLRVELHRLVHVLDLIPDRPGPELRLLALVVGLTRSGRVFDRPAHRQQSDAKEYRDKPVRHGFPLECELDRQLRDDRHPASRHSFCRWWRAWCWVELTCPTAGAGQRQPTEDHGNQPQHQGRGATDYSVAGAGTTVGDGQIQPAIDRSDQPRHQGHDGSESPGGGTETTGGAGQSQPTDDRADQRQHSGRGGPESPGGQAVNRGGGRLGNARSHQHGMHKPPEQGGCSQGGENKSGGSFHGFSPTIQWELRDDRRPAARHSFCRRGRPWYWRKLTYPTHGTWLSRTCLVIWFRYASGLRPENSPKSRIRCDWSKNPQATATAAQSGSVAVRTNSRARWNRRTRPYSFGVRPTSAVKS